MIYDPEQLKCQTINVLRYSSICNAGVTFRCNIQFESKHTIRQPIVFNNHQTYTPLSNFFFVDSDLSGTKTIH